jgi:hypothetical protein
VAERAGVRVHWAVASAAGARVPFGRFAHVLPVPRNVALTITEMLSVTAARLTAAGERKALCVDDAHLLDPASAALVAHLLTNTTLPIVLTTRTGGADPPWLRDVPRLELGPLEAAQVGEVVQAHLGGPAETALIAVPWPPRWR